MKNLQQLEREYFVRKVGVAIPTEPLNNIKRRYFVSFLTGVTNVGPHVPFYDLEFYWLTKVITDGGGVLTGDEDYSALWKIIVAQLGKTPSKYRADNEKIFYLHAS